MSTPEGPQDVFGHAAMTAEATYEGQTHPNYLLVTKQEMHGMSERQGRITILGELRGLIENTRAEWTGAISVSERIRTNEITREDVEYVEVNCGKYYVPTTKGALVRCIDGRTEDGYDDNVYEKFAAMLGPQIPGGTLAGGVSYRHATSSSFIDFSKATIASDAKTFGEKSINAGYQPGDHSAHPEKPGLGCGAVDGIEDTHAKVNPWNLKTVHGLTKGVLGSDFRENHFAHFVSSANSLLANEEYFESKQDAIDYLKATNPNALPELMGGHAEVMMMINRVYGTTLHRDHLNEEMKAQRGKDLQVFNYDLWYTEDMAKQLFPESTQMQELYVHCRLAMAVAAIMYLTDGTLKVGVREAQKDYELVA